MSEDTVCYFPLTGGNCWTIGRSEDNSIVLSDRWMSRNHAMIQRMGQGEFYLIDLGSRNGTFVNGRRVSIPVALHNGDRITFGQTELDFLTNPLPPYLPKMPLCLCLNPKAPPQHCSMSAAC